MMECKPKIANIYLLFTFAARFVTRYSWIKLGFYPSLTLPSTFICPKFHSLFAGNPSFPDRKKAAAPCAAALRIFS
jgi:hypothetical protein